MKYTMIQELDEDGYQKSPLTYEEMSNPKYSIAWQNRSEAHKGKKMTDETKAKVSAAKKGIKKSEEHKAKIGAAGKGRVRTQESKDKMSASMKGRSKVKVQCPHCNKTVGGISNMNRWHGDNCKMKIK